MLRVHRCVITEVVDGNTVHADVDLDFKFSANLSFRLAFINAPEMKEGEPAFAAKLFLLKYKDVPMIVVSSKPDKCGRWVGEFWRESEFATGAMSINKTMLQLGLVKPYEG